MMDYDDDKEKNPVMAALNSLKMAVSAIEKEYTMQEGTGLGDQDGNIGQSDDGEIPYSKFENEAKKKMLLKAMKG